MSTRILGRPAPASNPAPEAVERLRQEALAEGEAELAGACAAALRGDPGARAALAIAIADDDEAEPCPVTLPTGGGW